MTRINLWVLLLLRRTSGCFCIFFGLLVALSTNTPPAFGQVELVTVEVEGSGRTVGHAINNALVAALTQVNGAQMAASTFSSEVRATLDSEIDSTYAAGSLSAEAIASQTKGAIQSYRLLSKDGSGGNWTVTIGAVIPRMVRSGQADRMRIAVASLRTRNDATRSFAETLRTALVDNLAQTRKFALLDRQFEAERAAETAIYASDSVPVEEMAKLGQRLGTDLVFVGTLDEAGVSTKTMVIGPTAKELHSYTTRIKLSYRLIHAPTGQIKYANTWSETRNGSVLPELAKLGAETITRQILDAIYPLSVESIKGDVFFIGQGGGLMRSGQKYALLQLGDTMTDSHTGESLGREEVEVGIVEIIAVEAKFAKAKLVRATTDVAKDFRPGSLVLRSLPDGSVAANTIAPRKTAGDQSEYTEKKDVLSKEEIEKRW